MSEKFPKTRSTTEQARGTSEIPGGYYRYQRDARRLQAEYTGSPDTFLDKAQEQEYAQVINAAIIAQKGIADLMEINPEQAAIEQARYESLFAASAQAQQALIETNLRFAAYYARASMNIVASSDDYQSKGRPGAYSDITLLRSQYADLDERTQVANEALVKAAQTFVPKQDGKGKPITFLAHAGYRIHSALSKHAKTEEVPGWYVNANQVDKLYAARKNAASVDERERERLDVMDQGRHTSPIDELSLTVVASEEVDELADIQALSLADIIPDSNNAPVDIETFRNIRDSRISEILDTLSEREAGVISMRFGLDDGTVKTLDEIGAVYGVTRERVRQIETKAMSKLRHPSRSQLLRDFLGEDQDFSMANPSVLPPTADGTQNIRTSYGVAHKADRPNEITEEVTSEGSSSEQKASWQAFPDEPWDMQPASERVAQTFEQTAQHFEQLLHNAPLYTFQHSFAKEMASEYPVGLVSAINEQLGASLTSSHIEDFWNHNINNYIASLQEQLGDDLSLDRVSALFARLLSEHMRDDDRIELHIPTELDGKLHGMGAGLQTGELTLYGNVGNFTGHRMGGTANVIVRGSTGDFAAFESAGYASLEIMGDAGHFAGSGLAESASLHVHGSVGDYCGQGLKGLDAFIEVDGDAGRHVGDNALRGVIDVRGVGESAQSNTSAMVSGEFAEWETKDAVRVSAGLGKTAVHPPYETEAVERVLVPQPKDPEAIIAEMENAAQTINPALLEHATPAPMRAELPPEHLTFSQACAWFGVPAERLNECLEEIGHAKDSDLSGSDITAMSELYEDLQVDTVPAEGFISLENVIKKFKIRETPTRFLRLLIKNRVPLYEFRDVDARVKYFMSNENL